MLNRCVAIHYHAQVMVKERAAFGYYFHTEFPCGFYHHLVLLTALFASSKEFITALKSPSAPYKMVPVLNTRGPTIKPAFTNSLCAKTISLLADGSCVVVTPYAKLV